MQRGTRWYDSFDIMKILIGKLMKFLLSWCIWICSLYILMCSILPISCMVTSPYLVLINYPLHYEVHSYEPYFKFGKRELVGLAVVDSLVFACSIIPCSLCGYICLITAIRFPLVDLWNSICSFINRWTQDYSKERVNKTVFIITFSFLN